jgi:hypothetical protein
MGTRSLTLVCVALVCAASARANLELNFKVADYQLDGMKFQHLVFSDGSGKKITYSPPTGWEYSGSGPKLTLHPSKKGQAEASVTSITLPQPGVLDDEGLKKLTEEALMSVPRGSTNVTLVSQQKNPVIIEGKETFLVTVAYSFYGGNYKRSVMFLNRGKEQLRFELVSREQDFDELQKAFLGSQFSWQNL